MFKRNTDNFSRRIAISWWLSENGKGLAYFALIIFALAAGFWYSLSWGKPSYPIGSFYRTLNTASSITLSEKPRFGMGCRVKIVDPKKIDQIALAVYANPTKQKLCSETDSMVIETPQGNIHMTFCPHCYTLEYWGGRCTYRMTPELLKALQNAVKDDDKRWNLSGWQIPKD